jgi:hypothetical protein
MYTMVRKRTKKTTTWSGSATYSTSLDRTKSGARYGIEMGTSPTVPIVTTLPPSNTGGSGLSAAETVMFDDLEYI